MSTLPAVYEQALCAERAPDDPRWEGPVRTEAARVALAHELWRTVCVDCPVKDLCLEWATEQQEHGIWAGTTEKQRRRMKTQASAPGQAGPGRSPAVV